jgi:hypothetical protein
MVGGDPLSRSERVTGRADADTTRPALTPNNLDAWADTARYLFSHGLTPLVPVEVCRALYRRGDRELAELLHRRYGGKAHDRRDSPR